MLISHDLLAGTGALQGVQKVHGHVHHHSQPESHLPASGRHSSQVSSQVKSNFMVHEPQDAAATGHSVLGSSASSQAQEDPVEIFPPELILLMQNSCLWSSAT